MNGPGHKQAEVLSTDTAAAFNTAVNRAAELLRAGAVVAIPTETVYGLAANAFNPEAVARLFEIKGRPPQNPIIVHVASLDMARGCVAQWPELAGRLADAFWPGPLTLVLPRTEAIPPIITAGGPTVGIRWPSHPFVQELIRVCDFPLAAPSANLSSELSPTTAQHARKSLGTRIPLVIDGGPSQVGIESTVLDLTVDPPRVLRPGMIHSESLLAVTGGLAGSNVDSAIQTSHELRSPGLLLKHYAPKARLVVCDWSTEHDLENLLNRFSAPRGRIHLIVHSRIPGRSHLGAVIVIPHDAEAFARAVYAELHRCDEAGAELILVEAVPDLPEWQPIADRLRRASSPG